MAFRDIVAAREKRAAIAMDPFSAGLNVSSNLLRESNNPFVTGAYDLMSKSSVQSGLKGVPTRPFFRGVFSASPLSQPLDPVLTAEDVGSSIRKMLLAAPEETRPTLLAEIQAMATPENIKKVPSEYRSGIRSLANMEADRVLNLIAQEGRATAGTGKGAYIAGSVLGSLFPQPQPAGQINMAAIAGANVPWTLQEGATKAVENKIDAVQRGAKPTGPKKQMGGMAKKLVSGILSGVTDPAPIGKVQSVVGKGLGYFVAPAVRSAVEQAQLGTEALRHARGSLEETASALRHSGIEGIPGLVGHHAERISEGIGKNVVGLAPAELARRATGSLIDTHAPSLSPTVKNVITGAAGTATGNAIGHSVTGHDVFKTIGQQAENAAEQFIKKPSSIIDSVAHNMPAIGPRSTAAIGMLGGFADDAAELAAKKKPGMLFNVGKLIGRGLRRGKG